MKFGVTFSYFDKEIGQSFEQEFNIESDNKHDAFRQAFDETSGYGELEDMEIECVELGEVYDFGDILDELSNDNKGDKK